MRVRLKGVNSRSKTLADGTVITYYYLLCVEGRPAP